jgi:hypothetical protein
MRNRKFQALFWLLASATALAAPPESPADVASIQQEAQSLLAILATPSASRKVDDDAAKTSAQSLRAHVEQSIKQGVDGPINPIRRIEFQVLIDQSLNCSMQTEWNSAAASAGGLRNWWVFTSAHEAVLGPDGSRLTALRSTLAHIAKWAHADFAGCVDLLMEADEKFVSGLTQPARIQWTKQSRSVIQYLSSQSSVRKGGEAEGPEKQIRQWLEKYCENESTSIADRTMVVAWRADQLYSRGEFAAADSLLTSWLNRFPNEASASYPFQKTMFFVKQIGMGERASARECLKRIDHLIETGAVTKDDSMLALITQNYYLHLYPSTLMFEKRRTEIISERRKTSP